MGATAGQGNIKRQARRLQRDAQRALLGLGGLSTPF